MKIIAPLTATAAAVALLSAGAIAQTPPKDSKSMTPEQTQTAPQNRTQDATGSVNKNANIRQSGQWRGSQLIGLNVYNNNNETIGEIEEVILNKDGKIELVVVGVGGWLGMGEHDVALRWEQVSFSEQPAKGENKNAARDNKPDHAKVNMTKEQLKSMPAFKYSNEQNRS